MNDNASKCDQGDELLDALVLLEKGSHDLVENLDITELENLYAEALADRKAALVRKLLNLEIDRDDAPSDSLLYITPHEEWGEPKVGPLPEYQKEIEGLLELLNPLLREESTRRTVYPSLAKAIADIRKALPKFQALLEMQKIRLEEIRKEAPWAIHFPVVIRGKKKC